MKNTDIVGLDFETYSGTDIKAGMDAYMADPDFAVLTGSAYAMTAFGPTKHRFIFPDGRMTADAVTALQAVLSPGGTSKTLAAHNVPFELACLDWLGIHWDYRETIDTAVLARAWGADSKLELAAPQMLGMQKMESGRHLIKLFSVPGKFQEANGNKAFDWDITTAYPDEWFEFGVYCDLDAELSWKIADRFHDFVILENEIYYGWLTQSMNQRGWAVDMQLVKKMKEVSEENRVLALEYFYDTQEPGLDEKKRLNFNSPQQLKRWAEARGIRSKSFDEEHVAKLLTKIKARLDKGGCKPDVEDNLNAMVHMLEVKQILGGSSLKKLDTIIKMVGPGDRLRGQYMHCGAGQTLRTSGRGVQMQNLKRLGGEIDDVETLFDNSLHWNNARLARNIRQCFKAGDEDGFLLVGDFASVESRGLAYEAGAAWKVDAFHQNKDMYKVLASQMYSLPYEAVTKEQRQTGKVGELACGYGAGPGAVQRFASKMGVEFSEEQAAELVMNWRNTNPEIVDLWGRLNEALQKFVADPSRTYEVALGYGMHVSIGATWTPDSLTKLHKEAVSMYVEVRDRFDNLVLRRFFHGLYLRGRDVCHWKASENYGGDPWRNHYIDPATGEIRFYKIYGGKLTGIITQSLCRELFFRSVTTLEASLRPFHNADIIGQFHDEIVVEWRPSRKEGRIGLVAAKELMESAMKKCHLPGFPLVGEIKHDYRYTK